MKLRCWPGCMARITKSRHPENVGLIVEVLYRHEQASEDYGAFCWKVRASGRPGVTQYGLLSEGSMPDFALTPLTPPPSTDMIDIHAEREDELVGPV